MERITSGMTDRTVLANLENTYNQLSTTQTELSSGTTLTKPSDNPFAVSEALNYTSELAANTQYQSNVSDGSSLMAASDTALSSMNNDLQTAQNLVIQGANGALSQSNLDAIATQLNQLAESIKTAGNTQFGGSYIFAGTATQTPPFTLGGADTYNGNSAGISLTIGQGVNMQVNVTGDTVVTPILAAIRQAVTDLQAGGTPGNLGTTDLQAIQDAASTLAQTQAVVGAGENRLTAATSRLQQLQDATTQQLSGVQDTDVAQAMVNFSQETAAYQAALKAGASLIQPTLMDYLTTT
jgi:flagellar hook-associated protein 3 FlgL